MSRLGSKTLVRTGFHGPLLLRQDMGGLEIESESWVVHQLSQWVMRSKVVLVLPFWQLTQIPTLNCGPLTLKIVIKHSFFVAINFFFLALMFSVILVPTIADLQPKLTFDFDCLGDLLSRIFIRMVHGKNNLNLPWEICVAGAMKYTQKIQNEHWGYSPLLLHVC